MTLTLMVSGHTAHRRASVIAFYFHPPNVTEIGKKNFLVDGLDFGATVCKTVRPML